MRRLAAFSLIAAPMLLLLSEAVSPDLSDDGRQSLATVAAEPLRLAAWVWIGILSAVLFIPAVVGIAHLRQRRGGRLVALGAALGVIGSVGYAVHQALFMQLPSMTSGDPAEMAAVYERQAGSPAVAVVTFLLFLVPLMVGLLVLGIGLYRAGVAPLWPALAIALAILPSAVPLPIDLGYASFALLVAGMGGYAWLVLRIPDRQWTAAPAEAVPAI